MSRKFIIIAILILAQTGFTEDVTATKLFESLVTTIEVEQRVAGQNEFDRYLPDVNEEFYLWNREFWSVPRSIDEACNLIGKTPINVRSGSIFPFFVVAARKFNGREFEILCSVFLGQVARDNGRSMLYLHAAIQALIIRKRIEADGAIMCAVIEKASIDKTEKKKFIESIQLNAKKDEVGNKGDTQP